MIKNPSLGGQCFECLAARRFAGLMVAFLFAIIFSLLAPTVSQATIINYPDMSGVSVDFTGILENTHEPGPAPLFGTPALTGDSLGFVPINFAATALGGPAFETRDGLLQFMSKAKTGNTIQNINFAEGGAVTVVGVVTDDTRADVSAVGFVNVIEIDGHGLPANTAVPSIPIGLTFSFGILGNGSWGRLSDGFSNATLWTGSQSISITQELINRNIPFVNGATKIIVNLDNSLTAQAAAGGGAYIDKKRFFIVTVNTPEPTSCLLALFGLVAGMVVSRRSR